MMFSSQIFNKLFKVAEFQETQTDHWFKMLPNTAHKKPQYVLRNLNKFHIKACKKNS